jgi:caffeoyl-CoA O-methyltransferase
MLTQGKYVAINEALLGYLAAHSSIGRDPVVQELRDETSRLGDVAVMQLNLEAGGLLTILAGITGSRRILELGTFTGFSTICLARGLSRGGVVVTCDRDPQWLDVAKRYWSKAGVADRIEARTETAENLLRESSKKAEWDFVFIDADKDSYPFYYEHSVNLLKVGGVLVMDNALRHGDVVHPRNEDELAVALVNNQITQDPRMQNVILPVGDGLQVCWKVSK